MFAIPPAAPEIDHVRPLCEAIDELCEILEVDRATVIEELTEIIRRRAAFEHYRQTPANDGDTH